MLIVRRAFPLRDLQSGSALGGCNARRASTPVGRPFSISLRLSASGNGTPSPLARVRQFFHGLGQRLAGAGQFPGFRFISGLRASPRPFGLFGGGF